MAGKEVLGAQPAQSVVLPFLLNGKCRGATADKININSCSGSYFGLDGVQAITPITEQTREDTAAAFSAILTLNHCSPASFLRH